MSHDRHLISVLALALIACHQPQDGGASAGAGDSDGASGADAGPIADATSTPVTPPPTDDPVEPVWQPNRVTRASSHPDSGCTSPRACRSGSSPMATTRTPTSARPVIRRTFAPTARWCSSSTATLVGTVPPDPANLNLWELRMPNGLPPGTTSSPSGSRRTVRPPSTAWCRSTSMSIPSPRTPTRSTLALDLVLTGTTDLDWSDAVVNGNGHTVTAAAGYAGNVMIHDSLVTGSGRVRQPGRDRRDHHGLGGHLALDLRGHRAASARS